MKSLETYRYFWNVYVLNGGEDTGFFAGVWRDTAASAERFVRSMYPNAQIVQVER